jgi:hypothetical protein
MVRMCLVAAAILAWAAAADAQFEGTVRMKTVTYLDGDSTVILPTVFFKGPLFAAVIDAPPGEEARGGRFILRGDRGVMWIIGDQEKKYIEIPVAKPDPRPDSGAQVTRRPPYTLTKTGQAKSILGYPCEEWIADEGGGTTSSVWATEKLGGIYEGVVKWFDGMSLENAGDRTRWEREVAGMGLFPMLVVRTEEGDVVEREEVVSVEKTGVPDRVFEAPAGYEKQSIDPNFEKMFEQMMKEMEKEPPADTTRDDGGP